MDSTYRSTHALTEFFDVEQAMLDRYKNAGKGYQSISNGWFLSLRDSVTKRTLELDLSMCSEWAFRAVEYDPNITTITFNYDLIPMKLVFTTGLVDDDKNIHLLFLRKGSDEENGTD